MDQVRNRIYLAALLHDIGKFYQRGSDKPVRSDVNIAFQQILWTKKFIEEHQIIFKQVLGTKSERFQNEDLNQFIDLVCNSQQPKTKYQALITLADRWSRGIDNCEAAEDQYERPLYSIFNEIHHGNYQMAFTLSPLNIETDKFFPEAIDKEKGGNSQSDYAKLWNSFSKEFDNLPKNTPTFFLESLLFLLKKYTWCIPANTSDMTNVTLFEHLKTTAAFTDCLFQYMNEYPQKLYWDTNKSQLVLTEDANPVLLLGGDISSIQKFIYNIASTKASVSLKGRSFYLQLFIDSIIQRIISHPDIEAHLGHIVYSSGGKFYMLLPNTVRVREAITVLIKEFEEKLWEEHKGQLLINFDYIPFAYISNSNLIRTEEKNNITLGNLWKNLAEKLNACKYKKFKSVLLTNYDRLFFENPHEGAIKVCAVTGLESTECVQIDPLEEESPYVLPIVKEQISLGKSLKNANYIFTFTNKSQTKEPQCNAFIFGVNHFLLNNLMDLYKKVDLSKGIGCLKRINSTNFLLNPIQEGIEYRFQFYGGNEQAQTEDHKIKTFDQLTKDNHLGILRMDVDGLGAIFIKGLPDNNKNFAAYCTLSFMLDCFFSGYLNSIRHKYANNVNILYSGGDDIFAIGHWEHLILFAKQTREDFKRFVGRKDISISGGLVILGNKFPIAKAALMAGDAEAAAKNFNFGEKNAINLFGQNISWEKEFEEVVKWKDRFRSLCCESNMPLSILHKIMLFACCKQNQTSSRRNSDSISYIWNTVYYLKRFSEGKDKNIQCFCESLKTFLFTNSRNYDLAAIAARWAELEIRNITT